MLVLTVAFTSLHIFAGDEMQAELAAVGQGASNRFHHALHSGHDGPCG